MTDSPDSQLSPQAIEALWADLDQLIANSHLFRSLDANGRKALLEKGRVLAFAPQTVIVQEGEHGDCFYLIENGVVEVSTQTQRTGEVSLTTLQRGAVFGEVSVLNNSPRTATVTALTDVNAVVFDRPVVEEILARDPKAKRLLDAMIRGRAKDAAEKIARAIDNANDNDPHNG